MRGPVGIGADGHLHVSIAFRAAYGAGSLATATFVIAPQLLLLFFMTEVLGVPPAWAGTSLLLPKLLEFFTDPIIGRWSDRLDTPWGRRRPLMAVGAVLFLVGFALLFAPPRFNGWGGSLCWILALYALTTSAFTCFEVPYFTMLAELTDDPHERTRLSGWRSIFLSVGFLVAGGMAPSIVQTRGADRDAYALMGIVIGTIAFAGMMTTVVGTSRGRIIRRTSHAQGSLLAPLKSPAFTWLWLAYVLQMASVGINSASLAYYNKYWLGNGEFKIALIFLGTMTITVLGTPAWTLVARRVGKYRGFVLATVLYAAAMGAFWFAKDSPAGFWFAVSLLGVANGGQQLFCFAVVPDVIAAERTRTGAAAEGAFTGLWVLGEKIGLALGAGFTGVALHVSGYAESAAAVYRSQSPAALFAILVLVSVVPALLLLASIVPLLGADRQMQRLCDLGGVGVAD